MRAGTVFPMNLFSLEKQAGRWEMSRLWASCGENEGANLFLPDEQVYR